MNKLAEDVRNKATAARGACRNLVRVLKDTGRSFDLDAAATNRGRTALACTTLVEALADAQPDRTVSILAGAGISTSEPAMAASISQASRLGDTLQAASWELFDALANLTDARQTAASGIRRRVADALAADEYVVSLPSELREAQSEAVKLLAQSQPPPPVAPVPPKSGRTRVDGSKAQGLRPQQARELFASIEEKLGKNDRRRLTVDWEIEEEPGS